MKVYGRGLVHEILVACPRLATALSRSPYSQNTLELFHYDVHLVASKLSSLDFTFSSRQAQSPPLLVGNQHLHHLDDG